MSTPEPGIPPNGDWPETDSSDSVIYVVEGEEDPTIRPLRPEIARRLRKRQQQSPPDQPPAPEKS